MSEESSPPPVIRRADEIEPGITFRMFQVIQGIRDGLQAKEIGYRLGLSHRTVEIYVTRSKKVLGAANRMQLVLIAIRRGLIGLDHQSDPPPPPVPIQVSNGGHR